MTHLLTTVKGLFEKKTKPQVAPMSAQMLEWLQYLATPGELFRLLDSCRETIRNEGGMLDLRYGPIVAMIKVIEPAALLSGTWTDSQDFFRTRMDSFIPVMERLIEMEPYSLSAPLVLSVQQWSKFSEDERKLTLSAMDQVSKHPKIRDIFIFQRDFAINGGSDRRRRAVY